MTPPHLFRNRTSTAAFYLTFIHSLLSFWVLYFLPVYFQAVQLKDPSQSGVLLLPTATIIVSGGIIGGFIMSKTGKYRLVHFAGFGFMAIGTGTFILLDEYSGVALYVCLQLITGLGSGRCAAASSSSGANREGYRIIHSDLELYTYFRNDMGRLCPRCNLQ